jgi:hypothetical protein
LLSAQQAGARAAYTLVSVDNTRSMRNSLRTGYEATSLARLRIAHDDAIDWPEVLGTFDRAGYGSACRAWLMIAQRLLGQAPPAGFAPSLGALRMLAERRQIGSPRVMAIGESYGHHRAMIARLGAGPIARQQLLARLLG